MKSVYWHAAMSASTVHNSWPLFYSKNVKDSFPWFTTHYVNKLHHAKKCQRFLL